MKARLIRIGNSRGVRIPQKVLEHYRIQEGATLELEERQDGILIRPQPSANTKVSWEQAYQEMVLRSPRRPNGLIGMVCREMRSMIERYGIFWVNLDPVQGSEISKTQPAVVISDDNMNRLLDRVVVCPLTSHLHPHWPCRIQSKIDKQLGEIAIDQIRTIDKSRIGKKVDHLDPALAEEVRHIITQMYGVLSVS